MSELKGTNTMKDRQLEDLLDEQSRSLRGLRSDAEWLARLPEATLTLAPLFVLAREIAGLLVPIKPRPEFRGELHRSLVTEGRQQQAQRLLDLPAPGVRVQTPELQRIPDRVWGWISQETNVLPMDRRWVLGAAAVGSAVSLAGILAYVLSRRGNPAASA